MRRSVDRLRAGWRGRLADDQEPFKAVLVLFIAALTFLAAALAALQLDAGANAATAGRTADAIGADAAGRSTGSLIQTNSDLGVYRRWLGLRFDTVWAQRVTEGDAVVPEDGDGVDPDLASELLRIDRDLAEWARRQSPLLLPPYKNDAQSPTDIASLDAERNVGPNARADQERRIALAEAASWGRRAADYVTAITLIAVSLFFVGLAAALGGTARRILAASGMAFGLVALLSGAAIAVRSIDSVPAAAVDAIVDAEMAMARAGWAASTERVEDADRRNWEAAIAASERAVQLAPGHPSTWLARANARLGYANDLLLAREASPDEAGPLLDQALADYRHYTAIDDTSYTAWWSLGWAAYLDGDAPTAIAAADRALALAPDQFSLYLNRGLARLSAGDVAGHRADIDTALSVAASAGLDSNGWFFGRNDHDIGRLAALRPEEAPQLADAQRRIREAAVSARIGRPIAPDGDGSIDGITVSTLTLLEGARLVEHGVVAPNDLIPIPGVAGFRLSLTGRDIPDGAMVSVRVWEGGVESPEYRIDRGWPDTASEMEIDLVSPYGRMGNVVDAAEYEIEIFINGATRAGQKFRVEEPTLRISAAAFVQALADSGHTCEAPRAADGGGQSTTCVLTGLTRDNGLEGVVTAGAAGSIERLVLSTPRTLPLAESIVRQTGGTWFSVLLEPSIERQAQDWIAIVQPGGSATFGAATFSLDATTGAGGRITLEMTIQ